MNNKVSKNFTPRPHVFKMLPSFKTPLLSLFILSLLLSPSAAVPTTTVGFTYSPAPNSPPPEHVVTALQSLKIPAVRLLNPSPTLVRAFSYSNISLLLTVPNYLVGSFASNRSAATLWVYNNVLPFHPRARISLISVGSDVITSPTSGGSDPSAAVVPAMQNLHRALNDLGIRTVSVSTTFSFINVITTAFPPSSAEFQEPVSSLIIRPVLQFLEETNSSLLVNVYPYNVYRLHGEIPVGFALFQEGPFNFRDDVVTAVRYHNLFDMMIDAVIAAMAVSGYENVPLIVTETGWPSDGSNYEHVNNGVRDAEESQLYAEMYLQGLVSHLKSGLGTPLRKEGVSEAYIYQLFDESETKQQSNLSSAQGEITGQYWGVMYTNMSMKYNINFDSADRNSRKLGVLVPSIHLLWLLSMLVLASSLS
ncbi:glucan endo-1,3-beta-glucosidase-like [Nicotiana tabacum]|uniref:Glucan endo-1,3-beta-glucosidase, acidic-like n=1 Tax=Nicotiana tabacum TaxID=4097 RepID=A0A1S3YSD6_TOBAC|nr:glucan endo-1,3-beta-glucosidase [Nicotiana tomentosiformis]XP_016455129.1 PREDICTED: glucan endo-1,3-beta-glucosidase, acidic-like [Nicotiana tabacum]